MTAKDRRPGGALGKGPLTVEVLPQRRRWRQQWPILVAGVGDEELQREALIELFDDLGDAGLRTAVGAHLEWVWSADTLTVLVDVVDLPRGLVPAHKRTPQGHACGVVNGKSNNHE